MDNRIILIIIFLATFVATCSTLKQKAQIDVRTNSKKVVIKGNNDAVNIHVYKDTLIIDTLKKDSL